MLNPIEINKLERRINKFKWLKWGSILPMLGGTYVLFSANNVKFPEKPKIYQEYEQAKSTLHHLNDVKNDFSESKKYKITYKTPEVNEFCRVVYGDLEKSYVLSQDAINSVERDTLKQTGDSVFRKYVKDYGVVKNNFLTRVFFGTTLMWLGLFSWLHFTGKQKDCQNKLDKQK